MKLKNDSFAGGIYLRVPVRSAEGIVVGELTRWPRHGWRTGPATTYSFVPNDLGRVAGLRSTSDEVTIKAALERASA